ncbi:MAG TPA: hypothetical protein VFM76_05950 [Methylophaga sp.]|nr:hypothetical protein [Methylophaga sp.]
MNFNSDSHSLDEWAKHHAHKNVFEHDGKIIDSENAFRAAGLHVQANPSYQDWLSSI